jgi:hypothetical protein
VPNVDTTEILDEAALEEYETKLATTNMEKANTALNSEQDALKKSLARFDSTNKKQKKEFYL